MERDAFLWHGSSNESDRGFVIVSHAYLDMQLSDLCKAAFAANKIRPKIITKLLNSKTDEGPPPLQGFWMKAILLHAFGLIEDHVFDALVELNTLRNTRGAHSPKPYQLDDDEVKRIVSKLDKNLAAYVTNMAERNHASIVEVRNLAPTLEKLSSPQNREMVVKMYEKHTYARFLLETFVFVLDGFIAGKSAKLAAKD